MDCGSLRSGTKNFIWHKVMAYEHTSVEEEMRDSKGQRINSLQGLRAILFVLIFTFHTSMIGNISESLIYINFFKGGGQKLLLSFLCCRDLLRHFIREMKCQTLRI